MKRRQSFCCNLWFVWIGVYAPEALPKFLVSVQIQTWEKETIFGSSDNVKAVSQSADVETGLLYHFFWEELYLEAAQFEYSPCFLLRSILPKLKHKCYLTYYCQTYLCIQIATIGCYKVKHLTRQCKILNL